MKNIGLYLHIPFCHGKCPYCDFYSVNAAAESMDEYTEHMCAAILSHKDENLSAQTVYIGGGTPSVLGTTRLCAVLECVRRAFGEDSEETTVEVNPESAVSLDFARLRAAGVNRISMGLQSAVQSELALLGRKHTAKDVRRAVNTVRGGGIDNISLDLMLGIGGQTKESLSKSIDFCDEMGVSHISAYMLKIEEGTPYAKVSDTLGLPDEDSVCELYEFAVNRLAKLGYLQYEISNFAKPRMESKHNLKYWRCEEYLGIGAAAHSFMDGKRFYCGRSLREFYSGEICNDGTGGDMEEYIAMKLRLNEGLRFDEFKERYGTELPNRFVKAAKERVPKDMIVADDTSVRLTVKGFLCSNSVISNILYSYTE